MSIITPQAATLCVPFSTHCCTRRAAKPREARRSSVNCAAPPSRKEKQDKGKLTAEAAATDIARGIPGFPWPGLLWFHRMNRTFRGPETRERERGLSIGPAARPPTIQSPGDAPGNASLPHPSGVARGEPPPAHLEALEPQPDPRFGWNGGLPMSVSLLAAPRRPAERRRPGTRCLPRRVLRWSTVPPFTPFPPQRRQEARQTAPRRRALSGCKARPPAGNGVGLVGGVGGAPPDALRKADGLFIAPRFTAAEPMLVSPFPLGFGWSPGKRKDAAKKDLVQRGERKGEGRGGRRAGVAEALLRRSCQLPGS